VSDGAYTEVTPLRDAVIGEGLQIITRVPNPAAAGNQQDQGGPPSGLRRLGF
jgi:hypothetical protein